MKRNASIEQMFDDMDHAIIRKYVTFPLKSTFLIILSVAFIELDTHLPPMLKHNLTPFIAIVTMIVMFWGFVSGVVDKTYYKYMVTGNKINFTEFYYEKNEFDKLTKIIENQDFANLNLLHKTNGNGIKLKIAYTEDKSLGYVQVIKYVPFQYAKKTEVIQLESYQINKLFDILENNAISC
ncbi:MAG: hypothetical protein PHS84_01700 [Paludibacter sp.]|nr:hypothetical protein [Paludibacter sp.]